MKGSVRHKLILLWGIGCISWAAIGQGSGKVCADSVLAEPVERKYEGINDTVLPVLRLPEQAFYETFRNDPAFSYITTPPESGWWQRFKTWLSRHLQFEEVNIDLSRWTWVLRIAALVVIVFFLYQLIKHRYAFSFRKREKDFEVDSEMQPGTVDPLAFLQQIEKAEKAGKYEVAIRLHFLYLLRCLDAKDIIEWDIHKSNLTYFYEIKDQQWRLQFKKLSRIFECVCYGEFPVDRENYQLIASQFEKMRKEVEE